MNPNARGDRNPEHSKVGSNRVSVSCVLQELGFVFPPSLPLILSPGASVVGQQPKAMHVHDSKGKIVCMKTRRDEE